MTTRVLLIGGSSEIGLAIVRRLATEGPVPLRGGFVMRLEIGKLDETFQLIFQRRELGVSRKLA